MRLHVRHLRRAIVLVALVTGAWLLATEPWGLGIYQLVMFAAPGALLGLGAAWMSHAGAEESFTWGSARRGAVAGATILPPFLAFLVAIEGSAQPQRLLVGFVYAAWAALLGGAGIAVLRRRVA